MVVALVCWSFEVLARRLLVCLLQQVLLRQALSCSGDGAARTAGRFRLALASVYSHRLIVGWSNDIFVIFVTFVPLCNVVEDY
jgi:hypothetical protein